MKKFLYLILLATLSLSLHIPIKAMQQQIQDQLIQRWFHLAVKGGDAAAKAIRILLNGKLIDVNIVNPIDCNTALHYAAKYGHEPVVEILLKYKASIDKVNNDGDTALHYAIKYRHNSVVKILLDKGANPNIDNKEGFTPLQLAVIKEAVEIVQMLLADGADLSPVNKFGRTAIFYATANGANEDIAKMILQEEINRQSIKES